MSPVQNQASITSLCCAFLLASCAEKSIDVPADSSGRPVKLIHIAAANTTNALRYPAVIRAGERAELSFLVGGNIEVLAVKDATEVAAGDLIAKLDARDFESSAASARASFANAEEEYKRAVRLAKQDAIAKNVLEQRRAQRDVARAQLNSAEKALTDSVLRAPFAGVVADVPVREKQTVSAGTAVATVIDITTLEATINMPASIIARVPSQEDRGAIVLLEAAPGQEIQATYREASLVADATSQTYAVTFAFEGPDDILVLPGMNATVVLTATANNTSSAPITVPLAAVQSDGTGKYVWVVDETSMTVSRRGIQIAPGIGENLVVTAGLSASDQIVGAGAAFLAEGVKVAPWTE